MRAAGHSQTPSKEKGAFAPFPFPPFELSMLEVNQHPCPKLPVLRPYP
jgi:hypothetical protein